MLTARDPSQKSLRSDAKEDFEKAKLRAPAEPDAYLELAEAAISDWRSRTDEVKDWDLQLMSSVKDVSGIPTSGKKLIIVIAVDHVVLFRMFGIVAVADHVLHFRIFDGDGKKIVDTDEKLTAESQQINDDDKKIVDTDEKKLTAESQQINDLGKLVESLRPPHKTKSEKDRVVSVVTSSIALAQETRTGRGKKQRPNRGKNLRGAGQPRITCGKG